MDRPRSDLLDLAIATARGRWDFDDDVDRRFDRGLVDFAHADRQHSVISKRSSLASNEHEYRRVLRRHRATIRACSIIPKLGIEGLAAVLCGESRFKE